MGKHGRDKNCVHIYGRKPEGKNDLRDRRRIEDDIQMDLNKQIRSGVMD
jgi:hypothetical protein